MRLVLAVLKIHSKLGNEVLRCGRLDLRRHLLQDHAPLGNGALDVAHAGAALGAAARLEHGDKVPHLLSVPYAQQPHQHALYLGDRQGLGAAGLPEVVHEVFAAILLAKAVQVAVDGAQRGGVGDVAKRITLLVRDGVDQARLDVAGTMHERLKRYSA